MAQIIDLHRTPTFIGQWPGDEPQFGDSLAPLFIAFQGAGMALADFVSGRDAVRGDLNLSEMGKVSKIAEVGRSMLDRIEKLKAVVTRFQADVKTKETALQRAGAKASTDVPAALRQIEIREWFRSLTPEDRIASIARALDESDTEVLTSILSAPKAFNLVAPPVATRIEDILLQQSDPGAVAALRRLRDAVQVTDFALSRAASYIASDAGLDPSLRDRLSGIAGA